MCYKLGAEPNDSQISTEARDTCAQRSSNGSAHDSSAPADDTPPDKDSDAESSSDSDGPVNQGTDANAGLSTRAPNRGPSQPRRRQTTGTGTARLRPRARTDALPMDIDSAEDADASDHSARRDPPRPPTQAPPLRRYNLRSRRPAVTRTSDTSKPD